MSGGWIACLGLVLLAHYCCTNADHLKPSNDGASSGKATPTLPVKKGEQSKRARNFNPFLPYYNPDPNQDLNQPDFARNTPPFNPNPFFPFNPFMYFNPAMLMMLMGQQNPFNQDLRVGNGAMAVARTVTSTSVIQSTITETTTHTTTTPFIETTTIVIPSTSTSTIVIPYYATETFILTSTSTSTIVVPEYSTTTILAFTNEHLYRQEPTVVDDYYEEERRNHRQARVPKNF